jgi:RNA polymerase sigma factor (sigma-70 family)
MKLSVEERNALVVENLDVVYDAISLLDDKYTMDPEMLQEGNLSLVEAADAYTAECRYRFRTFALKRVYKRLERYAAETNDDRLVQLGAYSWVPAKDVFRVFGLDEELMKCLAALTAREAFILEHFYGLDGDAPYTLAEIGQHIGVTEANVWSIKNKALRKLRHPSRAGKLVEYFCEF